MDFLTLVEEAGFADAEMVAETGFNSSPITKGVLFRAVKSEQVIIKKEKTKEASPSALPAASMTDEPPQGKIEYLTKKALELGADRAKIISTNTVVVEEWVRWKCQYGCSMYAKDSFHPPLAPDTESTKKVLSEYSTALLINGHKGKLLTDIALRLEGEAYHIGYYKAFALTSLSSSALTSLSSAPGAT